MGTVGTDGFCQDAARIALSSKDQTMIRGRPGDLWVHAQRDRDVVSAEDRRLARKSERLRHEIRIRQKGKGHPEKGHRVLRDPWRA